MVDPLPTAEELLRLAERDRELAMAQAIANIGSFTWRFSTGRIRWSDQMYAIMGVGRDHPLTVASFDAQVHPDDLPDLQANRARMAQTGVPEPWEGRIVRPDGDVRRIRVAARAFEDPDETVIVGVVEDVTERRALEAQAMQAEKMAALARLAGNVAHDFNNLLLVIMANAAMLAEDDPSPELEEILEAVDVAKDLTRRLLAFGQSAPFDPSPVDLSQAVKDLSEPIAELLAPDQILAIRAPSPVVALLPAKSLQQILVALARNASEAMDGGGVLEIVVDTVDLHEPTDVPLTPGTYARVRVKDTGIGMDEATLARATEPFFTTKEPGQGAGLGLSMVYGMVRLVGGAMTLTAPPEGGTLVTLWFRTTAPRSDQHRQSAARARTPNAKPTILVLEDEPAVLRIIDLVLRRAGFDVHTAADPGEALAIAQRIDRIDLVLSDVVTPGGGGERLVRELRELGRTFELLFISGFAPQDTTLDGPVLLKPFLPGELLARVKEILGVDA